MSEIDQTKFTIYEQHKYLPAYHVSPASFL